MKFRPMIDAYVGDMKAQGRINSERTVIAYRACLMAHAEDVGNRDPRLTGRDDVKRTLRRWKHPNSQRTNRSILVSFYTWLEEEGFRDTNPARQTPRPKRRPTQVYRLTRSEVVAMMGACKTTRERRAIFLGICAGLRSAELLGLQGRHFQRPGFVWVSPDIGKGGRQRWVPVLGELAPIVDGIKADLDLDEYVLPAQRWRDPGVNREKEDKRKHSASAQALYFLVKRIGVRAGIAAPIHPHLLRHAFGDFAARHLGIELTRALLGHANVATTKTYVGEPSSDELSEAVAGLSFMPARLSLETGPANPAQATTGIEPVLHASRMLERLFASPTLREAAKATA